MKRAGLPYIDRGMHQGDPMENLIRAALTKASTPFVDERHPDALRLDFYLPDPGVHIEVKQMHSDRIAEQMSRAENVVAAQGRRAVEWLAGLIKQAAMANALTAQIAALQAERAQWTTFEVREPGAFIVAE